MTEPDVNNIQTWAVSLVKIPIKIIEAVKTPGIIRTIKLYGVPPCLGYFSRLEFHSTIQMVSTIQTNSTNQINSTIQTNSTVQTIYTIQTNSTIHKFKYNFLWRIDATFRKKSMLYYPKENIVGMIVRSWELEKNLKGEKGPEKCGDKYQTLA